MNGGHDRLFGTEQPIAFEIKVRHARRRGVRPRAVAIERAAVAEIGAGAKHLALRGKNHGAAFVVGIQRLERSSDFPDQGNVEKVVRRTPDFHQRHMTGFLDADILERSWGFHDAPSSRLLMGRTPATGELFTAPDDRSHAIENANPAGMLAKPSVFGPVTAM